jgi:hypothetical protein
MLSSDDLCAIHQHGVLRWTMFEQPDDLQMVCPPVVVVSWLVIDVQEAIYDNNS